MPEKNCSWLLRRCRSLHFPDSHSKPFSLLLSGFLLLASLSLFAQDKPQSYIQEIAGTRLAFGMVAIPGGEFIMGSPAGETGRHKDEGPQHTVQISPFWMSSHEVSWDLFEPFVYKDYEARQAIDPIRPEVDAVTRPTKPYLDMTFGMGKEGHPAVGMTQYAAIQFCKWLYMRTGVFYRLPTEAEWEYACRAGSSTAYAFGNKPAPLADYAWYKDNSSNKTHPIGTKKANAWGLYDMHGNVAEWTMDQYIPDYYQQFKGKVTTDPVAVPLSLYPHVIRGGSFADATTDLRCARRASSDPDWKKIDPQIPKSNWWFPEAPFVGIRLVRPLHPPSPEEIEAYYNRKPIADF